MSRAVADRVAVVDIGTNTLLLLIAERDGDAVRAVIDECRFGRLGQGLDQTGALADAAIERSLAIMDEYGALIREHEVTDVRVVATQALREASNARRFIEPAEQHVGATIEVIAGEREAELVYKAVAASLPELSGRVLVVDVGGGSTELILAGEHGVESCRSIHIGSVRHTERYLKTDPPTADEVRAMNADLDVAIADLQLPGDVTVVGTAGTATSIASIDLALPRWQPERVQGYRISAAQLAAQLDQLLALTVAQRRQLPGLEPARADVVAAGVAIFARVLEHTGAAEMVISDRGVRWGLAYEALS